MIIYDSNYRVVKSYHQTYNIRSKSYTTVTFRLVVVCVIDCFTPKGRHYLSVV